MGDGYTNGYTSYTETLFTRYAVVRRVRSQVRTHYARASQSTRESVQRLRPQATQNGQSLGMDDRPLLVTEPTVQTRVSALMSTKRCVSDDVMD